MAGRDELEPRAYILDEEVRQVLGEADDRVGVALPAALDIEATVSAVGDAHGRHSTMIKAGEQLFEELLGRHQVQGRERQDRDVGGPLSRLADDASPGIEPRR